MDERQLRDSIRDLGPLLPRVTAGGIVIDGARRERFSHETGRRIHTVELAPADAPKALWLLHPERAIIQAGKLSIEQYADLFGVRVLDVARHLQAQRRQAPAIDADELGKASSLVQTWWPPRLRYVASIAAEQRGLNLSAFVREAVATHCARVLDLDAGELARAPLAGNATGHTRASATVPGVEHRPGEKRRRRRRR